MNVMNIGNRVEMLVDDALIESTRGLRFELNRPMPREVVIRADKPWEGVGSLVYNSVFEWNGKYHLYYRATGPENKDDRDVLQYICYACSEDGVRWEKPNLGIYDYQGSTENNILMGGDICHNFTPFPDVNPDCPADQIIKALAGYDHAVYIFVSGDGMHFKRLADQPALTSGAFAFDSQNVLFYDAPRGVYRIYARYWEKNVKERLEGTGVRAIMSSESKDCIAWSEPVPNEYVNGEWEHLYTNATTNCPGAEHMLISMPMRFVEKRVRRLMKLSEGMADAVFMTSRDGVRWDRRFSDSLVGGGLDERGWTQRCNMPTTGILMTDDEFSFYITRRYSWEDVHVQRFTVPKFRFASLKADIKPGKAVTRPIVFEGGRLYVNARTAVTGDLRAEIINPETGRPYEGFALKDCAPFFGDALDEALVFKGGDLKALAGKPVVLRFSMRLGELYAFRFGE